MRFKFLFVVLGFFLLCSLVAFLFFSRFYGFDIFIGGDTARYLEGSERIFLGYNLTNTDLSYLLSNCYMYLWRYILSFNSLFFVLINWVLYFLSLVLIGKINYMIFRNKTVALTSSILFFNFEIFKWNQYILMDSFTNLINIVTTYFLVCFAKRQSLKNRILSFLFCSLATIARPEGFLFLFVWSILFLYKNIKYWYVTIFSFSLMFLWLSVVNESDNLSMFATTETIWGASKSWIVPFEPNHIMEVSGLCDLIFFVFKNFIFSLVSFIYRLVIEIIHVRPFFSLFFNLFIILTIIPINLMFLPGFLSFKDKGIKLIFALILLARFLIIGLTHADYDGRFLIASLPWIIPFAAWGFYKFFKNVFPK